MRATFYPAVLAGALLLSACGTSKKLDSANTQIQQLNNQVSQLNSQLAEKDKALADLQRTSDLNSQDAAKYRIMEEEIRRKKEKLDQELAARGTSLEQIEARAEKSVRDLEAAGCQVYYKQGRFHITVPEEFVFGVGQYNIKPKGREALNVVAQVMYDNPGVSTTIIGHTDTLPIKGNADNWTLSSERANAVVRVLTDVYNINPKRLTGAGRSKFHPVASNDTPEGRAKNRRIEILINPNLDRLVDMMQD